MKFLCYLTVLMQCLVILCKTYEPLGNYNRIIAILYVFFCCIFIPYVYKKSHVGRVIIWFLIIYFFYVLGSDKVFNELNSKWGMLSWTLQVMMSFFPGFYFYEKKLFSGLNLVWYSRILLIMAIFLYVVNFRAVIARSIKIEEGITNNIGYLFITVILLLLYKPSKNILFIIVGLIFVIMSLKRGAILCSIFEVLYLIYFYRSLLIKRTWLYGVIFLIIGLIAFSQIQSYVSKNSYVQKRIEQTVEGIASERNDDYSNIIDAISDFDTKETLFGRGINATMRITGNFAHNDWLELMVCQGVLGVLIYILFFYTVIKQIFHHQNRSLMLLVLFIMLERSMLSFLYFDIASVPLFFALGIYSSRYRYENSSLHSDIRKLRLAKNAGKTIS